MASSNGVYGTNVGASITSSDVDIFYSYSPTRDSDDVNNMVFKKLDSSLISQAIMNTDVNGYDNVLEGMYNLKLPMSVFNKKGFYTVYIKPREIPVVLLDVGVLSSYPDVKGLVVDTANINEEDRELFEVNNNLVGYRIVYFDDNKNRQPFYRIVTSNNKCEPIVQNLADVNQKAIRYRYNESSSLTFITVTPSVASTFKPNALPYIGTSTQRVVFVNTKFEPICLDIEMTEHDVDTISTMLEGSQLRDLDNGLVTTFNANNEIYHQSEHYTLKSSETNNPIFEVKKERTDNIDFTQTLQDKL